MHRGLVLTAKRQLGMMHICAPHPDACADCQRVRSFPVEPRLLVGTWPGCTQLYVKIDASSLGTRGHCIGQLRGGKGGQARCLHK